MTLLVVETSNFTIGVPVTPTLRRDFIRAEVPPVPTLGTTVVMRVSQERHTFIVKPDRR